LDILASRGLKVEAIATDGPATAAGIARRCINGGADLILAAGGDGTINEVVNGMAHSSVPLGILPAGTANVLANELAIGATMERAAKSLDQCVPERIALGLLSSAAGDAPRHFLLMAGAGLDAQIVHDINYKLKDAFGKVAYWIAGFSKVGSRMPEFTVEAEGREFLASFALASRVRNYGGDLEIAPSISLLDDQFELVLFEGASSFTFLKYMMGVVVKRHQTMRGVTILRTRKALFSGSANNKIHLQVDGEYAGLAPGAVEIVPNALTLLVPPGFRVRRPAIADETAWTTSPTR
jgi:YegS/Rv2252/BmrU family lipid kinase